MKLIEENSQQRQLTRGQLLDENGHLTQAGYSTSLVKQYRRSSIAASLLRIKEWDYYYVGDNNFGIALTIADLSYSALVSVTLLDFNVRKQWSKSFTKLLTMGKIGLSESSQSGEVSVHGNQYSISFKTLQNKRYLKARFNNLKQGNDFYCEIELQHTTKHSMVIAIPFEDKRYFYYNQKINLLQGKGYYILGDFNYTFHKSTFGVLDWGRGVWTYSNTWYWASMSGLHNGHLFGFNLGYGFGNTQHATENMFFYDQQVFKLNDVQFNIKKDENGKERYLEQWSITSKGGEISIDFKPLIDRSANINYLVVKSDQHQVFGLFSGCFKIQQQKFRFQNLIGFAEKVYNRW